MLMPFLRALLLLCLAFGPALAQGEVREGLTLPSATFKKPMRYTIYLPPGYELSKRTYPVAYLLHGFGDDDSAWVHNGEIAETLDRAIAARQITPMIVVMPDGDRGWYVNSVDGSARWEDYFFKDFMPFIEERFRVRRQRASRAIGGVSAGGFGALSYVLRHSERFTACMALSPSLRTPEEVAALSAERWNQAFAPTFGPGQGEARITAHWQSLSPFKVLENAKPEAFPQTRIYLDCGDRDPLLKGAFAFHALLDAKGVQHALRVRGGGHSWGYWRAGLLGGLTFLSDVFRED
jgi:S-formylglutathione hydrolase FrmB